MATPIIPDFFRAQVVFTAKTGQAEDVVVNTFGFNNSQIATKNQMADGIRDSLFDFYGTVVEQSGQMIASMISGDLVENVAQIKIYDLGDPPPRQVIEREITLAISPGAPLPPEVALCASFYGNGRNLPRQRGRVFLGPLKASYTELVGPQVRWTEPARTTVAHAMRRLMQGAIGRSAQWNVISPTAVTGYQVTNGWVDDAIDIQRRRGTDPTVRTTFDEEGVVNFPLG